MREFIVKEYETFPYKGAVHEMPELIRCKDCKWNTAVEWVHCAMVGGMFGRTTDNYCSLAERKEQ